MTDCIHWQKIIVLLMMTAIMRSAVWTKNVSQKRIVKRITAMKTMIAIMKNVARTEGVTLKRIVMRNARMILIVLMMIVAQTTVDVIHLIPAIDQKIVSLLMIAQRIIVAQFMDIVGPILSSATTCSLAKLMLTVLGRNVVQASVIVALDLNTAMMLLPFPQNLPQLLLSPSVTLILIVMRQ